MMKCEECGGNIPDKCPKCGTKLDDSNTICGRGIIPENHCFKCWKGK